MPRGFIRWETPRRRTAVASALLGDAAPEASHFNPPLPCAAQPMAPRDEAVFLLHTAAEVEHALLVQYLYAAFSFGDMERRKQSAGGDLSPDQHNKVFGPEGWNTILPRIAIEEMCHLMTIQNVLRVLGGPLNLEREDFPFRTEFYPFPFTLEPVSKDSLAKYVAAEMPQAPDKTRYPRLDEILERARLEVASGMINRVGLLYSRILNLIGGLPERLFHPETSDTHQAPHQPWRARDETTLPPNKRLRIVARFGGSQAEARAKVLTALRLIAEQGEGPGADPVNSHFDLFYALYVDFPETNPEYGTVTWHPALPAPTRPNTSPPGPAHDEADQGRITHHLSLLWAQLFNTRYRMLLASILHSLSIDRSASSSPPAPQGPFATVVRWALTEMTGTLRSISDVLTRLPCREANPTRGGRPAAAGAPFELPYSLNLPDRQVERWQLHRDLVEGSRRLREAILADQATQSDPDAKAVLESLTEVDTAILSDIERFGPSTVPMPAPTPTTRYQRVIQILDDAIGGPSASIGAHGTFWRGLSRAQFVAYRVFGSYDLLVVGDGAGSNLVKALKGEAPFNGDLPRMPLGFPPVLDQNIGFIQKWIDDGCPEDPYIPGGAPATLRWRPTNAPLAGRYDDVWFHDASLGWAVNSNGEILHTTDGGARWETQTRLPGVYLRCVAFASPTRGWVGNLTPEMRLLETSDGGKKWVPVGDLPKGAPPAVCGLCVVNESVVYAAGSNVPERPVAMMKTLDGGHNWTAWDMRPWADNLIDVYFTSPDRGWVIGGKADDPMPTKPKLKPVILYTEDGGATWVNRIADLRPEFPLGEWGWKIHFVDDRIGFIALQNYFAGAILATTDCGMTWKRHPINDPQMNQNIEGIGFVDARHGWVGGWGDHPERMKQYSSETLDGGLIWRNANEIGKNINRFRFLGTPVKAGYASGRTIYKYSSDPVPAPPPADAAPRRLLGDLEPTAEGAPVRFVVPTGAGRLSVRIWDCDGGLVRTLLDEPRPMAGRRALTWDRTDDSGRLLPPGAFIWRVTVGQTSESRIVAHL
jgi:photosystem II stability/assembly factor-like uncharacterized protein